MNGFKLFKRSKLIKLIMSGPCHVVQWLYCQKTLIYVIVINSNYLLSFQYFIHVIMNKHGFNQLKLIALNV